MNFENAVDIRTFEELKTFVNSLNEEQLKQQIPIFIDDEETAHMLTGGEVSQEDIYWEHHGDMIGNLEKVKEHAKEEGINFNELLEDLVKCPAGTVQLWCEV